MGEIHIEEAVARLLDDLLDRTPCQYSEVERRFHLRGITAVEDNIRAYRAFIRDVNGTLWVFKNNGQRDRLVSDMRHELAVMRVRARAIAAERELTGFELSVQVRHIVGIYAYRKNSLVRACRTLGLYLGDDDIVRYYGHEMDPALRERVIAEMRRWDDAPDFGTFAALFPGLNASEFERCARLKDWRLRYSDPG